MRSEIFYWLLNMSVSASIIGIIIYLLSKIRRIPRRIICLLWLIPLVRMWIPVGINSRYSLMSLIARFTAKTLVVYEGAFNLSMTNLVMGAETYFPLTYKTEALGNVMNAASVVWIAVTALLVCMMAAAYYTAKSDLKNARHLYDNIYSSGKISSPAVYGVFRGKIILPEEYGESDLRFILLHENMHIKRGDNLWRMIAVITACLHCFNPLSWLFLKSFLENLELACDEAVLSKCADGERKAYAETLLNSAESKSLFASAFGGAKVRVRIERILSYRKLSAFSMTLCFILAIVIGYVLITNAE